MIQRLYVPSVVFLHAAGRAREASTHESGYSAEGREMCWWSHSDRLRRLLRSGDCLSFTSLLHSFVLFYILRDFYKGLF